MEDYTIVDELKRVLTNVAPSVLGAATGKDVSFEYDPRIFMCSSCDGSFTDSDDGSDLSGDLDLDTSVPDAINVHMHSNKDILREYGPKFHRLSLCVMSPDPKKPELSTIILNKENWMCGGELLRRFGTPARYHDYIVCHEFGHSLGLDHAEDGGRGTRCDVMVQQTLPTSCEVGVDTELR